MSVFDDFVNSVTQNAKDSAGQAAADFLKDATAQGTAFRAGAEVDLQLWNDQLARGEIDQELLASLVRGEWDMAVLAALAKSGKTAADAKVLAGKIIDVAIDAAFKSIPGGPVVQAAAGIAKTIIEARATEPAATPAAPPSPPTAKT